MFSILDVLIWAEAEQINYEKQQEQISEAEPVIFYLLLSVCCQTTELHPNTSKYTEVVLISENVGKFDVYWQNIVFNLIP